MPFGQLKRREFITLLGGAVVWPRAANAQQSAPPLVGFLGSASSERWASRLRAFHKGIGESGYVEDRNVRFEYRWAEGRNDRLPELAAELVRREVAVIAALGSTPAALAAKAATKTIPIVFEFASDPIALGLVDSLARPGGNVTGVASLNAEVAAKRLQLLHELVPSATNIALLVNPTSPRLAQSTTKDLQTAAASLGLQLQVLHASTEREIEAAFAKLAELRAGGIVIGNDALFSSRPEQLAALANRHAMPAVYQFREFAADGGLLSYGSNFVDSFRLAGVLTGRILKGEKPADLPVMQATNVELIINLKTATALGLSVPLPLLGRADEVIE